MNVTKLDAEELLHLAMRESDQDRHEQAIEYLKRARELSPDNANIHYMLGAEHAEIGLYDRAAEEMAKAVEIDPGLMTAHFQLGLLYITSGRLQEAEAAWKPLDTLGEENAFFLFRRGLLNLANDEFESCVKNLRKGMELNDFNQPLNKDMQRVLDEVYTRQPDLRPADAVEPVAAVGTKPGHVFLSAYETGKDDD